MSYQLLTANRLNDGAVVYLDRDGTWSTRFDEAWVVDTEVDAGAFEDIGRRGERARIVVGSYLMDVVADADAFLPIRMRERIRAEGPTVETVGSRPAQRAA
jgi:hypothetical protein